MVAMRPKRWARLALWMALAGGVAVLAALFTAAWAALGMLMVMGLAR